ncbi:MAG TPA: APC family permease [Terriglobia bacterium]|nr:APC family permease [Terriglobia bacterium]
MNSDLSSNLVPGKNNAPSEIKLRRVLKLHDLVIYGIILIQPVAALPLFGHANHISRGHAVTTILLAMVAMVCTAASYGRMASRYPLAGSAYTYVGKALHPHLGFLAGWAMFLDYLLVPLICAIYTSVATHHLFPAIPYTVWILFYAAGFTVLNLYGIKVTAGTNWVLLIVMSGVVFGFMAAAIHFVVTKGGAAGLLRLQPLYDPKTFSFDALWAGTALAALTYGGFDGLTTLSEEVENPRRNMLLAVVLTCLITGIWSGSQVYLAQLSWPEWQTFGKTGLGSSADMASLDTAILAVARRVGGAGLDAALACILVLASVGSGITGQAGAARLLYGMGRDGVLPRRFFGRLDRKHAEPVGNLLLIGALVLAGALSLNYEETARLINFGAFLAFMGVNLATLREFFSLGEEKTLMRVATELISPIIGFVICALIWWALPLRTHLVGGVWLAAGIIYLAVRTKGFQQGAVKIDFSQV